MRQLPSFIMWNHAAIAHASWRCVHEGQRQLGYIGCVTTALSLMYHRHSERVCVGPEGICAKACILLMVCKGVRAGLRPCESILPSAGVFILWRLSQRNYERWHPWMHIVVAADAHYFLHCIKQLRARTDHAV